MLIINYLIIIFLFLSNKHKWIVFYILVLIPGFHFVNATFALSPVIKKETNHTIRILSFNVKGFQHYQSMNTTTMLEVSEFVDLQNVDIVCMQEFYDHPLRPNLHSLRRFSKSYPYYFYSPVLITRSKGFEITKGLAVFSRFPIVKGEQILISSKNGNMMQYVDLIYDNDTIRVINVHLESIDHVLYKDDPGFKNYMKALKLNLKYKAVQAAEMKRQISDFRGKMIICGDFNDTPYQFSYQLVKKKLKNTFEYSGKGLGFTFSSDFPLVRIDHIFASKEFKPLEFTTFDQIFFSDHFPVMADLGFN